jgi:hypothetical protein
MFIVTHLSSPVAPSNEKKQAFDPPDALLSEAQVEQANRLKATLSQSLVNVSIGLSICAQPG